MTCLPGTDMSEIMSNSLTFSEMESAGVSVFRLTGAIETENILMGFKQSQRYLCNITESSYPNHVPRCHNQILIHSLQRTGIFLHLTQKWKASRSLSTQTATLNHYLTRFCSFLFIFYF